MYSINWFIITRASRPASIDGTQSGWTIIASLVLLLVIFKKFRLSLTQRVFGELQFLFIVPWDPVVALGYFGLIQPLTTSTTTTTTRRAFN